MKIHVTSALVALALAGATIGSTVVPAAAAVYGNVNIRVGPPAPQIETIPVAPGPGYAWHPGVWRWNGERYIWVGGRYFRRPYGNAEWVPGHWVHRPQGWVWRAGHWR